MPEMRVGKNYDVQTPNLHFSETRRLFSMLRFLPFKAGAFLTQHFNIDGYPKPGNNEWTKQRAGRSKTAFRKRRTRLFPDSKIPWQK